MKRAVALLAFFLALLFGWRLLGSGPSPSRAAAQPGAADQAIVVPVSVTRVARGEMARTLQLTGTLRTDFDVRLTPRIAGRVAAVTVREGDRVRPGQLLVQLDTTQLRANLDKSLAALTAARARLSQAQDSAVVKDTAAEAEFRRATANLAAARLRLSQARSQAQIADTEAQAQVETAYSALQWAREKLTQVQEGARRQERRQAELAVEQAKASLEEARSRWERRQQLVGEGAVASEEADAARRQFAVAEAQYRSALEQLQLLEEGPRSTEIRMAQEEVRQAEERLRQAQANLARRAISRDEVEAAEAAVHQAEAALAQAKAGLAQKKLTQGDIRSARAAVAQAEAEVAFDRQQLADARIVSPVAGVVVTRSVNPGEAVGTATTLLRIVASDGVYFEGDVPERELPLVKVGQPVKVSVDALPGLTFRGTVHEIIPVAGEGNRAFRARVLLSATGRPLPVGGFARGEVLVARRAGVLVVPREVVRSEAGDSFVYCERDGRARRIGVVTGLMDSERVEIVAGLSPGDRVVTRGGAQVSDGDRVRVVSER